MLVRESELMHYGVLGMKWGHRKSQPTLKTQIKTRRKNAKKEADIEYTKIVNTTAKKYKRGQQWSKNDVAKLNKAYETYNKSVKDAEKKYHSEMNDRKRMHDEAKATVAERGDIGQTKRQVAKYMVEYDMPIEHAKEKATFTTCRNVGASLAVSYGVLKLIANH